MQYVFYKVFRSINNATINRILPSLSLPVTTTTPANRGCLFELVYVEESRQRFTLLLLYVIQHKQQLNKIYEASFRCLSDFTLL